MTMQIFIPTMGRVNAQPTYDAISKLGWPVQLVCPSNEVIDHVKQGRNGLAPPDSIVGISATRHWIMEQAVNDFVVMMDDDLTFAVRREDNPTLFRPAKEADLDDMLMQLYAMFSRYAHVSIAMREGANRDTSLERECCRVARVIGYDRKVYLNSGCDFRNSSVMDDFEATLFLLTRGYKNGVLNWYVQNQKSSGAPGGASLYRDLEMHKQAALTLANRYPRFVKTVEKTTKTAWGGATRTDVIVQWKKAYESSQVPE